MRSSVIKTGIPGLSVLIAAVFLCPDAQCANLITRDYFNFGHQQGYMYSRMDDAYFKAAGAFTFETGLMGYHTPRMPLVRNPFWRERTIIMVPLYCTFTPASIVELQAEITDLFIEFPYQDLDNAGGKSPRFKTKIRLREESNRLPAVAFTVGVTFSSAKPTTIWENRHNYDSSNGLAGAGTGVADYLLLFTCSKQLVQEAWIHARIGLAPLGSPVEYQRGSAQADEIPYGIALVNSLNERWQTSLELSGMYNGLHMTRLAHYSVARLQLQRRAKSSRFILNLERGLTEESDTWVAGFFQRWDWGM